MQTISENQKKHAYNKNIIVLMAGRSSRFFQAGYTEVKYKLSIGHSNMFELSILSLMKIINDAKYYFVLCKKHDSAEWVRNKLSKYDIMYELIEVEDFTQGTADTISMSLEQLENKSLPVITTPIDQVYGECPQLKKIFKSTDNKIITSFMGTGNYAWATLNENNSLLRLVKKTGNNGLASTGMYQFNNANRLLLKIKEAWNYKNNASSEFDIEDVINYLISENDYEFEVCEISGSQISILGTPLQYEQFRQKVI